MVSLRQHFVPNPVSFTHNRFRTKCNPPLLIHTRYDANKNKLTEGISAPMANYGFNSTAYDPADRLTAWNRTDGNLDQAWDLSLVGNWATFTQNQVQQTRSHTAVHEIAAIDASPIAHDPAGNLTRNAGDTLDRYMWDFDNRLLAADVDQDGTAECLYRHDALGRRVSKTVPDGEASATTVFVGTIQALDHSPHAMQVVAEYAADAAPASTARKFVYATYIDEPVMMLATNGATTTPYYYHQNSLYSVAALTDVSAAVVERYAYSAYGKPIFLDVSANLLDPQALTIGNPYLFTGRRLDEETGLYYYRARMYDAELGRFVSRDPIGYEDDPVNLYRYVRNTPLVIGDPSGYGSGMHPPEYYYHAWPDSPLPPPGRSPSAPEQLLRLLDLLPDPDAGMFCMRAGYASDEFMCFNGGCHRFGPIEFVTIQNHQCVAFAWISCDEFSAGMRRPQTA